MNFQIHFARLTNLVTFILLFNQLPDSFRRPHQSCHLRSPVQSTFRFISPASPILPPSFTCSINFQIHFAGLANLVTFIHVFNQLPDLFRRPHQSCHLHSPVQSTSRFISPASLILLPSFTCSINFQIHFAGLTNLVTFIHLFNQLPDSFHRPHQSCHLYSPVHSTVKLSFHHHHAQNQLLHHISFTACSKLSFSTNPFYCNRLMVPRTIFMEWIIRLDCFCIGGKWLLHQIQSLTPASKRTLSINPFHHHKLTGTHHICCCFALN